MPGSGRSVCAHRSGRRARPCDLCVGVWRAFRPRASIAALPALHFCGARACGSCGQREIRSAGERQRPIKRRPRTIPSAYNGQTTTDSSGTSLVTYALAPGAGFGPARALPRCQHCCLWCMCMRSVWAAGDQECRREAEVDQAATADDTIGIQRPNNDRQQRDAQDLRCSPKKSSAHL